MQNKILKALKYSVLAVLLATANTVYAKPTVTAAIKTVAVKYSLAMFGIIFFTVLIFVGLSVYNKFFVSPEIKDYNLNKDSLRSPTDKDDAILTFIAKNRLK